MDGENDDQIFIDTAPKSAALPELKNESTSPRSSSRCSPSTEKNLATFDPISMTSYESSAKRDPRRPCKSRPAERIKKCSTRATPTKRRKETQRPSDEEVRSALESFVNDGTVPPQEMKEYIIQMINRERVKSLLNGQYAAAKGYDALQKNVLDAYKQNAEAQAVADINNSLSEKRAEYQEQWRIENGKWDKRVDQQVRDNEEYNAELERRQEEELQAFRERWQAPEFIETFNKPSNLLLNLRYQETKLALTRNYDEAEELKRYANKQQKIEEEQMKRSMEEQMRKEFTALKERHLAEKENAKQHQEKTLTTIEFQRQRALKTFQTTDKPRQVSKLAISTVTRETGTRSQLQTPRTANSLVNFRYTRHAKLNLAPMKDGDFERLEERPKTASQSRMRTPSKTMPSPAMKGTKGSRGSRRLLPAL